MIKFIEEDLIDAEIKVFEETIALSPLTEKHLLPLIDILKNVKLKMTVTHPELERQALSVAMGENETSSVFISFETIEKAREKYDVLCKMFFPE